MKWPRTPVQRLQRLEPRFCPRRRCPEHRRTRPGYRYRLNGFSSNKRGRAIQRFICLTCKSSFNSHAFSPFYYLKRPELLLPIAALLHAGAGHRQIARSLGCAPSTVTRMSARLGRHALLLLARAESELRGRLDEPVVLDHFETFEFSQDLPFGVATAVGADSWFVYALDPAPHGRVGRRSPAQQKRVESRPRRPVHGGYEGSTTRILGHLLDLAGRSGNLQLVGDGHPAYDTAVKRHPAGERIRLSRFPNPRRGPKGSARSDEAAARDRAMFPVDLLHGLLRHSLATHKRETIAFGRRLNAILERLYLAAVWRNFVKGISERRGDRTTPAMRVGLTDEPWSWRRALSRRLFPDREGLTGIARKLYRRDWITPVLPSNTRHRLRLAY
jgi:transposase-like protein